MKLDSLLNSFRMREMIYAALIWPLIVSTSMAETKVDTTYGISKAWTDDQSLYVLYTKTETKVHYSRVDINGTILGEKKVFHLRKFHKGEAIGKVMSLERDGELLDEGRDKMNERLYFDRWTRVTEVNGVTTLSAFGKETQFHCDHRMWGSVVPIVFGDKLFYCGYMFFAATGKLEALPKALQSKIAGIRKKTPWGSLGPLDYTADGQNLLIRSITAFLVPEAPDSTLLVYLDRMEAEEVKIPVLENTRHRIMNNSIAHSPNGFVVGEGYAPPVVVLATPEKTEQITTQSAYSYLVVDDFGGMAYFLYQKLFTLPDIEIVGVKR